MRIAVDMTPLGPAGQNGGAGLVATSLVRQISQLAPESEQLLLTSNANHAELAALDAPNVRRVCASTQADESVASPAGLKQVARAALQVLPARTRVRAKDIARNWRHRSARAQLIEGIRPDLLFCPFTAPYFWQSGIPFVSIIHDLQHM